MEVSVFRTSSHPARFSCLVAAALFALPIVIVSPSGTAQAAGKPCTIKAYSSDKDLNGQNIRASASSKAKIIGQLPPPVTEDGFIFGPYFDILAVQGDWAQITNAMSWNGGPASTTRGWISTKFIRFYLQTEVGFAGAQAATELSPLHLSS
jgi:hypothetical protein